MSFDLTTENEVDLKRFALTCIDLGIEHEKNGLPEIAGKEILNQVDVARWRFLHVRHARNLYMLGREQARSTRIISGLTWFEAGSYKVGISLALDPRIIADKLSASLEIPIGTEAEFVGEDMQVGTFLFKRIPEPEKPWSYDRFY